MLCADESAVLIMQFALCHGLTGAAIVDLLSLLEAHMPLGSQCFKSLLQLKAFFCKCANIPMEIWKYCNKCLSLVEDVCTKCNDPNQDTSQFIHLPIADQIQAFMEEPGFFDQLSYRFKREKEDARNIEDVYDGAIYSSLSDDGILGDKCNISLKVNTDGVAVFKSTSFHLWPVYFQINELPPNMRTLSKYRILAGLWCGRKKPNMNLMFEPIASEITELQQGHKFTLADGRTVFSRVVCLSGHFDTPAKDDFIKKVHHNGNYGCSYCEEKGTTAKSGKGHTHVYPYNSSTETGFSKARNKESIRVNAVHAMSTGKPVNGIKETCAFSNLEHFDVVNGVGVDYMHTVCLGVMKRLLTTWFRTGNKADPYYIGHKVDEVDKRLLAICPPNAVTRTPRSVKDNLQHYKASEFKMWLLHYGPVCLSGILPGKYYDHFLYLTKGIYLLLGSSISPLDLQVSDNCLRTFCILTPQLYRESFMTINFHLLLHTAESVRQLGPL